MIYLYLSRRFEIEHDFLLFYVRVVFLRIPPTFFRTYAVKHTQKYAGLEVMCQLLRFDFNKNGICARIVHLPYKVSWKIRLVEAEFFDESWCVTFSICPNQQTEGRTDTWDKPGNHSSHKSLKTCLKIKRRNCLNVLIKLMQTNWRWGVATVDRSKYRGAFSILECV